MTKNQKKMLERILVTGVLFVALLVLEHVGILEQITQPVLIFIIYLVPYLLIGYDIIFKAFRNISHGQVFDENFLMMIATFGAFGVREYSEGVAVMLFYQIGELFQGYAVGKSRQSIADMMDICPEYANVEEDGKLVQVDPDDVEIGTVIVVKPGERIPLDGIVVEGESMVDTAALTGESVPRRAAEGDEIISGCVNGSGTLKVKATKAFEDSTVSKILELVENASSKKARVENFITRFAKYYTPVVTIGAVILAILPPIILGGGWAEWIQRACIFLVISCPCALVISVPLGFFGGIGASSNLGVLVKGSNYLEAVAEMTTIVFDKTGTLTKGEFKVSEVLPVNGSKEELLELAAHVEGYSNHPIANSVREAYGKELDMNRVNGTEEIAGHGIHTFVDGKEVSIRSPKDSFDLGIGMIHQHFKLIDVMTAAENIILGLKGSAVLDMKKVHKDIQELVDKYGFDLDPAQKVYTMSVSQKQTVEIVKMLYRGANILILDEPTAVLTPQEVDKLFDVLRNMRDDGRAIIIITHKLNEVLELSDRVSILRKGKYIGTLQTSEATVESLTEMMVGEKISLDINRPMPHDLKKRLTIDTITCTNEDGLHTLENVSFEAFGGEVLGVAGISGSGQKELLEAIAGLTKLSSGSVVFHSPEGEDIDLAKYNAAQINELGVRHSFVPEDRLGMGLVGSMGMTGNMLLRSFRKGKGFFTSLKAPKELAEKIKEDLDVVTPDIDYPVRRLSGGNVQKILVGREIASSPAVLLVAYPVRGLDINSSYMIYNLLNKQKERGVAVVCVAEDLDMLLEFCDRILVLCDGKVTGIVDARKTTKEEVGMLMTSHKEEK